MPSDSAQIPSLSGLLVIAEKGKDGEQVGQDGGSLDRSEKATRRRLRTAHLAAITFL